MKSQDAATSRRDNPVRVRHVVPAAERARRQLAGVPGRHRGLGDHHRARQPRLHGRHRHLGGNGGGASCSRAPRRQDGASTSRAGSSSAYVVVDDDDNSSDDAWLDD